VVREMRRARLLSVLPKMAVDIQMVGPRYGVVVVRNVGVGPALRVDLHIFFGDRNNEAIEHRHWLAHVVAPAEEHQFLPLRHVRPRR
jgi:hypothetical protein